jgi:hypothetical protein
MSERPRNAQFVGDRPIGRKRRSPRPTVLRYETIRVEGSLGGEATAPHYIDVLEVSSVSQDQEAAGGPEGEALAKEWLELVEDFVILRGSVIASHVGPEAGSDQGPRP